MAVTHLIIVSCGGDKNCKRYFKILKKLLCMSGRVRTKDLSNKKKLSTIAKIYRSLSRISSCIFITFFSILFPGPHPCPSDPERHLRAVAGLPGPGAP